MNGVKNRVGALACSLGYPKGTWGRLLQALTHKSYSNESFVAHNERLEFLGDAILGFLIAEALIEAHPKLDEGRLTQLRSDLVNTTSLAREARSLGLGPCLQMGKGERRSGGREKPSLLADAFEALLAALYLDQGIEAARSFLLSRFEPRLRAAQLSGSGRSYKTELQELVQARFGETPEYRLLSEEGPDHEKRFRVGLYFQGSQQAQAEGLSKKRAEREAARLILIEQAERLKPLPESSEGAASPVDSGCPNPESPPVDS